MRYLCVSVIRRTVRRTAGCQHDPLMHAYAQGVCFSLFCRTEWLLFFMEGAEGGSWGPFFFIREGPLAPFHKILAATPYNASSDRSTCLEDVFIFIAQQCASLLLCSFPVICVGVGLTILNSVCWCGCVHSQHHGSVRMRLF